MTRQFASRPSSVSHTRTHTHTHTLALKITCRHTHAHAHAHVQRAHLTMNSAYTHTCTHTTPKLMPPRTTDRARTCSMDSAPPCHALLRRSAPCRALSSAPHVRTTATPSDWLSNECSTCVRGRVRAVRISRARGACPAQ